MNVEKAKHIYEVSIQEDIPEDIILAMEGIDPKEYEEALKLYFETIEQIHDTISLGFEEQEPREYELYNGSYLADSILW